MNLTATTPAVILAIDAPTPPGQPPSDPAPFTVQGEVVQPDGKPLSNQTVLALDRTLGAWRLLGQGTTNTKGNYRITYPQSMLQDWGKARADLKVQVVQLQGATTPGQIPPLPKVLAESALILQAQPSETLNFSVGAAAYRGADEFSRVRDAVAPLLQAQGGLTDAVEAADVVMLARDAQLAPLNVARYVKATRWAQQFGVPVAVFYGLLRTGHASSLDALMTQPVERLWRSLQRAQATNVIAWPLTEALRAQLAQAQQTYLTHPDQPQARLLATTSLTADKRAVFTQQLSAGAQTGPAFWQALQTTAGFNAQEVADIQAAVEVQELTGGNTGLAVRLRSTLNLPTVRQAAALSVAQWRDTVLSSADMEIPDEVLSSGTPDQRRAAYAQMLYRAAEQRCPTASLAGQMQRDPVWAGQALPGFFAAQPEFEFRDQRVRVFLQQQPQALDGLPPTTQDDLLRLEQLWHLVGEQDKLQALQPLWNAGLRSAPQIAYMGRARLRKELGTAVDAKAVQAIYRQAVHVTSLALSVYLRHHPQLNGASLPALRTAALLPAPSGPQPAARLQEQGLFGLPAIEQSGLTLPEWSELFGSADSCQCTGCESTLSPAAYLVDCLAFLTRAVDAQGNTALDELLQRRPDLGALQLTQPNTETMLPHIDLVNEVLESIVASIDGKTLAGEQIGPTGQSAELLAAYPEHLLSAAYDKLRDAAYPTQALPFDLWAEEARRYLQQLGLARDELMRTLPPKPGVTSLEIATEALGMSLLEGELIRLPKTQPATVAAHWGYADAAQFQAAKLDVVTALLERAGIDYDALLRLLNTRYVNPARGITVRFATEPACSLEGAVLADAAGADLTTLRLRQLLDHLQRFMRLQRRLGCTEYELDGLLHALGVSDFNAADFLPRMADALALHAAPGLTWQELAAWWGDLDTWAYEDEVPSQYEAIFLDLALFPATSAGSGVDLRNKVFALRTDRIDLVITTSHDATLSHWLAQSDGVVPPTYTLQPDYAVYVQSATGLSAPDLLLLTQGLLPKDTVTGHVALNLSNLSTLWRASSLARALQLSVTELLRLSAITGVMPLRTAAVSAGPAESRRYRDLAVDVQAQRLSIEALSYVLLHESQAVAALAPTQDSVTAWADSLAGSFAGIVSLSDARITPELHTAVAQSLGTALAVDAAVLESLLFEHRPMLGRQLLAHLIASGNPDAEGLPEVAQDLPSTFGRLHKFGLAWNALRLDAGFLAFVLDSGPALGWMDIADFPMLATQTPRFDNWSRLVAAVQLQASSLTLEDSLFSLMADAAIQAGDPANFVLADFLARVSAATQWSPTDLAYLTGAAGFNLDLPGAMSDERALVNLQRAIDLIGRAGAAAEQVHAWAAAELDPTQTQAIKQALSLRYPGDTWLGVLASMQDGLRTQKRDALLGHALNTLGLPDSDAFYRQYLVDPEQSPEDRTSRIVLAHSAVQLFVQRILLNLEPFSFEQADAASWQWRKRYRMWEAARKVFLWPENWLEPELRDDKSAFFQELEDGLMQEPVTDESAQRLVLEYLHKINQVSQLEVAGLYVDEAPDGTETLHVIARSPDVPRSHYYRRREAGSWTPWEPVDLDIEADHLIPIYYNGRLYLFWPDFSVADNPNRASTTTTTTVVTDPQRADELRTEIAQHQQRIGEIDAALEAAAQSPNFKGDVDALEDERAGHQASIAELQSELDDLTVEKEEIVWGDRYLIDLGMNWSEYRDGRWSSKHVAKETLSYTTSDTLDRHYFTGWVESDGVLRMSVRINKVGNGEGVSDPHAPEGYVGYFYFQAGDLDLVGTSVPVTDPVGDVSVVKAMPSFHRAWWADASWSNPLLELQIGTGGSVRTVLGATGYLHYAHQYGQYGIEHAPFFYCDGSGRTFFAELRGMVLQQMEVATGATAAASKARPTQAGRAARPAGKTGAARAIGAAGGLTGSVVGSAPAAVDANYHYGAASGMIVTSSASNINGWTEFQYASEVDDLLEMEGKPANEYLPAGTDAAYSFTRFYDPYASLFLRQAGRHGVAGLLSPDATWDDDSLNLYRQLTPLETFSFTATYSPDAGWVSSAYPKHEIDFDNGTPCSGSNWELFFHIPFMIGTRLMQNQSYAEAREWFHHIFNPTSTDTTDEGPERFWKIRPFYEQQRDGAAASLDELLADGNAAYEQQVQAWESDPFDPHAVAKLRVCAYMQAVVMRYLECLRSEADALFARDTREDIDEARQLYMLAAELLGQRPQQLPAQQAEVHTPLNLLGQQEGPIGLNWTPAVLEQLSQLLPTGPAGGPKGPMALIPTPPRGGPVTPVWSLEGAGAVDTLLLFCLPPNEMLLGMWDTVADRLFKIRHSMNLAGQVRQLALLAPPIDPALLVRADAAGLSIASILAGLFAPRSNYRFNFMLQKALELCGEARGLGAALLAALEKGDSEALSLLRSAQEMGLLESVRAIKQKNVDEAAAALAGVVASRESAQLRLDFYANLERVSAGEQKSLELQDQAAKMQSDADNAGALASVLYQIPNVTVEVGVTPKVGTQFGGSNLGNSAQAVSGYLRARSTMQAFRASRAGIQAGYTRRQVDWQLQADLAGKEIRQLDQQVIAAEIRQQVAQSDLENHELQMAQTREVEDFLKWKFSGRQLYSWSAGKLASLYFQVYQAAYQLAVQAEAAFRSELGPDERSAFFVQPSNWDSLHKGLHAGDLLHQQLRQMEMAYLAANRREYELTKSVSLLQLEPQQLLRLRLDGECDIRIPEVLFDMDHAGHCLRRIKSVRLSLPCVTGPYGGVPASLTLTSSKTRGYDTAPDQPLVRDDIAALPQTAIATSTGSADAGLFEFSFGDARYLPFEGAGAISEWHLALPATLRPFDYASIGDMVLHLSYTARDNPVAGFKDAVEAALLGRYNAGTAQDFAGGASSPVRMLSLAAEFPSQWYQLLQVPQDQPQQVTLTLSKQHFPKCLDHLWTLNGGLSSTAQALSLQFAAVSCVLRPADPAALPADVPQIGISGLSVLTNDTDLQVTVKVSNGRLQPQDWKDLILLLPYEANT